VRRNSEKNLMPCVSNLLNCLVKTPNRKVNTFDEDWGFK
jgi:hypothetical protein